MPSTLAGLRSRASLTRRERAEMFTLLAGHFEGVTSAQFDRDLAEKNWVVEIRRDRRLLGFSTLLLEVVEFEGRPLTVIYSGDTIMDPEAWGSPSLARTWIAAVNHLREVCPSIPCHWLLLTSGFRTYRFLPVFWKAFFPRHDLPTPAQGQRLLDHLARLRYGDRYDAATGLVRFTQPQKLRRWLSALSSGRENNPDIAFFFARNPGHADGDELACLTEIRAENLTSAGRRMVAAVPR